MGHICGQKGHRIPYLEKIMKKLFFWKNYTHFYVRFSLQTNFVGGYSHLITGVRWYLKNSVPWQHTPCRHYVKIPNFHLPTTILKKNKLFTTILHTKPYFEGGYSTLGHGIELYFKNSVLFLYTPYPKLHKHTHIHD